MAPPSAPRGRVDRPDLFARWQAGGPWPLTLVCAPAGYGKTTLLAAWAERLRADGDQVAWVSLDSDDDHLQSFGAYVLTALRHATQGAIYRAAALLHDDPMTPVKVVVSVLLNELAAHPGRLHLVLDDVDRLRHPAVSDTLQRLLRYAPDHFHLLLGARAEPSLPLAEVQARGRLWRLGPDELRFSVAQAQCFFDHGPAVPLAPAAVAQLHQATEGWVAGLQLAALALRDGAPVLPDLAVASSGIDAYLDEAVLAPLPAALRAFLLRTAVLSRLHPALCDAMLGQAGSAESLAWLAHHNVFLRPLDAQRQWFRYHALLAEALQRRLQREAPDELPGLHHRAALWLAQQQLWPEAVRHALAAGELDLAADWVEAQARPLIDRSDLRTLLAWVRRLPASLVAQRPRLRLASAWALALTLRTDEAGDELAALQADSAPALAQDPALQAEWAAVSALVAGLADDSPAALRLGRQARTGTVAPAWVQRFAETAELFGLMYDGGLAQVSQHRDSHRAVRGHSRSLSPREPIYASVYRETMYGLAALVGGQLNQAQAIFEAALADAEAVVGRESAAAVLPAGYLAALHVERDQLDAAERLLAGREELALQGCALGSLLRYTRAQAAVLARRGDADGALQRLAEVRELARSRQWLRLRAGCDAESVRLLLRQGRVGVARQLADALAVAMPGQQPEPPALAGSLLETWGHHATIQARLLLAEGEAQQALRWLAPARQRLQQLGLVYQATRIGLLQAVANAQAGQAGTPGALAEAQQGLRELLPLVQREQLCASLIEEGEPLRQLLRGLAPELPPAQRQFLTTLQPTWVEVGLGGLGGPAGQALQARLCQRLSQREREVLRQMAAGLSNKAIGRALDLAPETIKWHLKNIYEKLGVGSRAEALRLGPF